MNYRNEALRALQALSQQNPTFNLGDLLYTCFQKSANKNKQSLQFLREISDEDLYTQVETAINTISMEDAIMTDEEFDTWKMERYINSLNSK